MRKWSWSVWLLSSAHVSWYYNLKLSILIYYNSSVFHDNTINNLLEESSSLIDVSTFMKSQQGSSNGRTKFLDPLINPVQRSRVGEVNLCCAPVRFASMEAHARRSIEGWTRALNKKLFTWPEKIKEDHGAAVKRGTFAREERKKNLGFPRSATRPCLLPSRVSWIVLTTPSNLPCATTLRSIIPRLRCNEISNVVHMAIVQLENHQSPFSYVNTRPLWTCRETIILPLGPAQHSFQITQCVAATIVKPRPMIDRERIRRIETNKS